MKIIKTHFIHIISIIALFFSACASTYGPRNSMGGYEEKEVGKNMLRVSFYGNQHSTKEKITRIIMPIYFIIINEYIVKRSFYLMNTLIYN